MYIGDQYHNLVVVAIFADLLLSELPAVWQFGTGLQLFLWWALIVVWIVLGIYDFWDGRIDQAAWFKDRFGFDIGRPKQR